MTVAQNVGYTNVAAILVIVVTFVPVLIAQLTREERRTGL